MFYVFKHTVLVGNIETDRKKLDLKLTAGVIHQVDILFQEGCNHEANVQIFQGNHQLWPSNRGSSMVGNATVVSFREFQELAPGATELKAEIWGDGIITGVDVVINIGLLPKRVLQPMSFEELLKAATGEVE
ncbi:MAG: hypothetical protein Q7J98_10225 [Kiritimatiellia bacterium]|nr:hypothetical protein [Kiritimatiellia bacterium]